MGIAERGASSAGHITQTRCGGYRRRTLGGQPEISSSSFSCLTVHESSGCVTAFVVMSCGCSARCLTAYTVYPLQTLWRVELMRHAPRPHPMQLIGPGTPPMTMSCGGTTPPTALYSHAEMSLHLQPAAFASATLAIARVAV